MGTKTENTNGFQQQLGEVISVPINTQNGNQVFHDRIVLWGVSQVGKTTFALQLRDHHYYCFDQLFPWSAVEFFGSCPLTSLRMVNQSCKAVKFVVDGWHLSDIEGQLIPENTKIYIIYSDYETMFRHYRKEPLNYNDHLETYHQWYSASFIDCRFFRNINRCFVETDEKEFRLCTLLSANGK